MSIHLSSPYLVLLIIVSFYQLSFCQIQPEYFYSKTDLDRELARISQQAQKTFGIADSTLLFYWKAGKGAISMGTFEQSYQLLAVAHDLSKRLDQQDELGKVYLSLGNLFQYHDYFDKAISWYERAIVNLSQINNLKTELEIAYNNIAHAYQTLGNHEKAIIYLKKEIALQESQGLVDQLPVSYYTLGINLKASGAWIEAINWLHKARKLLEKKNLSKLLADIYHNLAECLLLQSKGEEALRWTEKGEAITKSLNLDYAQAENYILQGQIALSRKEFGSALKWLNLAKEIQQKNDNFKSRLAVTFNLIGFVYQQMQEYTKSLEWFYKGLTLINKPKEDISAAITLNNIGMTYFYLKDQPKAIWCYREAIKVWEKYNSEIYLAKGYNNLATVYAFQQKYQEALDIYRHTLQLNEKLGIESSWAGTSQNMAQMFWYLEEQDSALFYAGITMNINDRLRSENVGLRDRHLYLQGSLEAAEIGISCAFEVGEWELGFSFSERIRARSLTELLTEPGLTTVPLPPEVVMDMHTTKAQLKNVSLELIKDISSRHRRILISQRDSLYQRQLVLEDRVRLIAPEYGELVYPQPATVRDVQRILNPDEVLIEFSLGTLRTYVFILTQGEMIQIELGHPDSIRQLVQDFRSQFIIPQQRSYSFDRKSPLDERRWQEQFFKISSQLHKMLWSPIESTGMTQNKTVILISDDQLHYLPFELLIRDTSQRGYADYDYLINHNAIQYYPSATMVCLDRNSAEKESTNVQGLLGVSITDFSRNGCNFGGATLSSLFGSAKEINSIIGHFGRKNSHSLIDENATEENFKSMRLQDFRYLHFSTHGIVDQEHPAFSRILLQPSDTEDGCLHLYEFFELELRADLVTFSACETGLGKMVRGEGMIGFTRALMYAGTSSIVLSLWQVTDEVSKHVYTNFYSQLGQNKYLPLRTTQLEMIASRQYSNPFYWAPFVFIGAAE